MGDLPLTCYSPGAGLTPPLAQLGTRPISFPRGQPPCHRILLLFPGEMIHWLLGKSQSGNSMSKWAQKARGGRTLQRGGDCSNVK